MTRQAYFVYDPRIHTHTMPTYNQKRAKKRVTEKQTFRRMEPRIIAHFFQDL